MARRKILTILYIHPKQMAQAYDFFWCARLLVAAGADGTLKNQNGCAASDGVEGNKRTLDYIPALTSAHSKEEIEEAMQGLLAQTIIDKSALVMGGMQKKRSHPTLWTGSIDATFKEICKKC